MSYFDKLCKCPEPCPVCPVNTLRNSDPADRLVRFVADVRATVKTNGDGTCTVNQNALVLLMNECELKERR